MKVLWLANVPSPYSVNFLNELGRLCNLTVLFELEGASDRDESWRNFKFDTFTGVCLKGVKYSNDKAFCPRVISYLSKKYDVIVVSNMATLTGILAIIYMRLKKIPYIMQGDGGFKKNNRGIKEKLKRYLISGARYSLSTGKTHDEYYINYGANPNTIFRIPFTSVYEKDILRMPVTNNERTELRKTLGLKETKIIVSVGQFIYRKGFDILLTAAKDLENVSIYIIGGKPTDEYISLMNEYNLKNIIFLDFMRPDKLRQYYRAADLFVLPTREDIWGLVVNEAMSQGLPVITTDGCIAGLELIENGKNGYIVPVNDSKALTNAIKDVFEAKDYNVLCENSIKKVSMFTIENTAKVHYQIFEKLLGED